MKKIIIFLLLIIVDLFPISAHALSDSSKSSIVMDLNSGRVLYSKNPSEKRLIASTTKIMTAIITLENIDLNKRIKIGNEILKMYGTNIYIEVGETMSTLDLLYGLLLRSGNDAAVALATSVSGNEEKFVKLMNEKAKEIGMNNTLFKNPHGLDEETKNYSTAEDMAILSKYAFKNDTYRKIVSTKKYTVSTGEKTYLWYNRNKLLNNYEYCTGGKNGYTPSAGKTLVTTATKDKLNLTIVTLNDPNEYKTHQELYDKYFKKYKNYIIIDKKNFAIDKNFYDKNIYLKKSFTYPLTEKETEHITTKISINNNITGPKVGSIKIYLYKKKIGELPIYSKKSQTQEKKALFLKVKSLFIR